MSNSSYWLMFERQPDEGGDGFDPTTIADCTGWWDISDEAAIVYATPPAVQKINDKSGLDHFFSAVETWERSGTQNGLATLVCDGVGWYATWDTVAGQPSYTPPAGPKTVFVVFQSTFGSFQKLLFKDGGMGRWGDANSWTFYAFGTDGGIDTVLDDEGWHCITWVMDDTSPTTRLDGAVWDNKWVGSSAMGDNIHLGANLTGQQKFNGGFAEMIFYERALAAGEIDQVEGYLLGKWGLT